MAENMLKFYGQVGKYMQFVYIYEGACQYLCPGIYLSHVNASVCVCKTQSQNESYI